MNVFHPLQDNNKMAEYSLTLIDTPRPDEHLFIENELEVFNTPFVGPANYKPLNIFLRDENGTFMGGLIGATYLKWLYVNLLWLRQEIRQSGYGSRMLQMAEQEAIRRGCLGAHLDTWDFQAPDFYKKYGYSVFGQLEDFVPGHTRYFLRKTLVTDQSS
jgi:GNAT superfamily N-acetyltransferase